MSKLLVSICCLAYNHENFIRDCLDGFIIQKTDFDFEILIHDDASTDKTADIIKEYEALFPKIIKPIYQSENQYSKGIGVSANFNFPRAKGKYIALCEGDDYWIDPYKLQKQVDFLEVNSDYGLVCTDFSILEQSTGKIQESLFKNQPNKFPIYDNFEDFLLAAGYMAPCTWLCRREFIPVNFDGHADGSFYWLLHVFANSKVHVLLDNTTMYRQLVESASHSNSITKMYIRAVGILKTQMDYIDDFKVSESFKSKVLQKHYQMVLPSLVALNNRDEIKMALFNLPIEQRSYRDKLLLYLAEVPFGRKLILLLYWLKNNIKT